MLADIYGSVLSRVASRRMLARSLALTVVVVALSGCASVQSGNRRDMALLGPAELREQLTQQPSVGPDWGLPKFADIGQLPLMQPSNDRDWSPDQAVLARADFQGDQVTVHNIRNCTYRTAEDYTVDYYDKTFDLGTLDSVDFIVVPLPELPGVAHTMLSFGFGGRDYLAVSVEIRKEKGESYNPIKGILRQYELMYVVGDERDLIKLRTDCYLYDVYAYRARATPAQVRALFKDVMDRVNKLVEEPEFYDTIANNCTSNIAQHVNRLAPGKIPYDYRVLLPGYSDRLAYDLGLLETDVSFEETKRRARVNQLAYVYHDSPDFSAEIRR